MRYELGKQQLTVFSKVISFETLENVDLINALLDLFQDAARYNMPIYYHNCWWIIEEINVDYERVTIRGRTINGMTIGANIDYNRNLQNRRLS